MTNLRLIILFVLWFRDKDLEEHIRYLEGLSMIAGVSHHDLLYSKAAPELPPAQDDEDDAKAQWEPRYLSFLT